MKQRPITRKIFSLALTALIGTFLVTGCPQDAANENLPVKITKKDFATLLDDGIKALEDGDYDSAIKSFESAYALDKTNPEAIVYSTLGRLAAIAVSSPVRTLVQNHLGITGYPGKVDSLVNLDWMATYTDEQLERSYYEGNTWVSWRDVNDIWFFQFNELTPKAGYYKYIQNRQRLIRGETTKRMGNQLVYSYTDDQNRDLQWWNGDNIAYYHTNPYQDHYIFDNTVSGYYYYDYDAAEYDENSGISTFFLKFVSDEEKYENKELSYYSDSSWYYWNWYDDAPTSNYYTYTGFVGPGYYRSVSSYELVSETPRYTTYTWTSPGMNAPSWFSNTSLYKDSLTSKQLKSSATYSLLLFANLLDKNPSGLNALLDDLLSAVFGAEFEAAYSRAATLNERVTLSEDTLEAFGLWDLFEGEVEIGKAELNLLFAAVRIFKASLEWVAAYDWNTDLNFLKNGPLWDDWAKLNTQKPASANLPLRNNFLKDRNNGMMLKSKADFIKAIDDSVAAYDSWTGANSSLPKGYKDTLQDYAWIKSGFTQLKAAINSDGSGNASKFYVKIVDSGATYTNTETDALFGIDMAKFFTPGQLAINDLIDNATIAGKGVAPKFYGYNDQADNWVEITQKTQLSSYEVIGFKFNMQPVKQIVIYGLEEIANNEVLPIFDPDSAGYIWDWYN